MQLINPVFGRHGSFQLRYGWLTKGIQSLNRYPDIFTSAHATSELGVGKNMVSSIKYWLQATQIIDSKNVMTDFGRKLLLDGFDTYLEDDATLWLLHLKLAKNETLSTAIYWLFHHFHKQHFTVEEAFGALENDVSNTQVSKKTLKMDISVILRMYAPHRSDKTQIEDMLESPLSLLNLISYYDNQYHFSLSAHREIPVEIFAYAIDEAFNDVFDIPVRELMHGSRLALGTIFRLSESGLVAKLENLVAKYSTYQLREDAGIFSLHRAGAANGTEYLERYYGEN